MSYIINSLLTQDLYKVSMFSVEYHQFPNMYVRVDLTVRSDVKLGFLKPEIDRELNHLCMLHYGDEEIAWMRKNLVWISPNVIDYLRRFYLFRSQIHTEVDDSGQLVMWAFGPWLDVGWFEVPCLAIVEELYMRHMHAEFRREAGDRAYENALRSERLALEDKIDTLNTLYEKHPFTLAEFGLRRRRSAEWEDYVVERLAEKAKFFAGTSNIELARKYGVKPSGTMAHEIYMGIQGDERVSLGYVQRHTWDCWMKEFQGRNGIMLTDIFGAKACFREMNWLVANSFSGFRHDSGDPIVWGELLIARLKELGIDPRTKIAVFSDNLDVPDIIRIVEHFHDRIIISFGVGTNLVNMFPGIKPCSIVMKLSKAGVNIMEMRDVLKLSDDIGKCTCPNQGLIGYAKETYKYEPLKTEAAK